MLEIQKNPAGLEQTEDFVIQAPFAFMRHMMDREAGHDCSNQPNSGRLRARSPSIMLIPGSLPKVSRKTWSMVGEKSNATH